MDDMALLRPTFHVEVLLKSRDPRVRKARDVCEEVTDALFENFVSLQVASKLPLHHFRDVKHAALIEQVDVVDYTGSGNWFRFHELSETQLDVQAYALKSDQKAPCRRQISQSHADDDEMPQARVLALPNVVLKDEWDSLVYEDHLPAQLLRYLTRMLGVMRQPGLNLSTFNWNRLCLLHGPPGSGKSTLCRALAQKLSIRLSQAFPNAILVEVNMNSMLSKYFGESGKLIGTLFDKIFDMAQSPDTLVCIIMDEVETIAASREKVTSGDECTDGLRATNQLLTALDRLRALPNIIVLCTSNLLEAIDPAFLDRVDIKQLIPSPSPAAIYNIFRSCLNELVRASLVDAMTDSVSSRPMRVMPSSSPSSITSRRRAVAREQEDASCTEKQPSSNLPIFSPEKQQSISMSTVPSLAEMHVRHYDKLRSPGRRVWDLAQKCQGFSGRTLRRLPILGLAMWTSPGDCSLQDAISALEAAVDQEMLAKQVKKKFEGGQCY